MDNIEQDAEQAMGGEGNNIGGNMEQDAMKDMSGGGGGGGGVDNTINSGAYLLFQSLLYPTLVTGRDRCCLLTSVFSGRQLRQQRGHSWRS